MQLWDIEECYFLHKYCPLPASYVLTCRAEGLVGGQQGMGNWGLDENPLF